jgi:poly(3-hydroxybutyrate) depolymerase
VAMQRGEVPGGHAYTRYIYHDASGRPNDEKWIVHQAGHAWSGGSRGGSYTNPQGPDASAAMVHFFNRNPGAP